jgi:hypothetical protein
MAKSNKFEIENGHVVNEYGERCDPSHELECWWELSYAQFLTIPRVAMQSMPTAWQDQMAGLLNELDSRIDWRPKSGRYHVQINTALDEPKGGRYPEPVLKKVPLEQCDYRHNSMYLKPPVKPTNVES